MRREDLVSKASYFRPSSGCFARMYSYRFLVLPVRSSKSGVPPAYIVSGGSPYMLRWLSLIHLSIRCLVSSSITVVLPGGFGRSGGFRRVIGRIYIRRND